MSFVRPGAAAALTRWREVLVGMGCLALGLWWGFGTRGLLPYIGYALIGLAGLLIVMGVQRARFRVPGRGPGIVRVTEDQISYFGPLTGGTVALGDLASLSLQSDGKPAHWVLCQAGQPDLYIPVTAEGAEALFDAFARLPGLRTEQMLAELSRPRHRNAVIWEGAARGPHARIAPNRSKAPPDSKA